MQKQQPLTHQNLNQEQEYRIKQMLFASMVCQGLLSSPMDDDVDVDVDADDDAERTLNFAKELR